MATTRPPHPPGPEPSAVSSALELLADLEATAATLQALAGPDGRLWLDGGLARRLWPYLPPSEASDRLVLHILLLEEAGRAVTWAQDGREWLAFPPPPGGPFSRAGEREGEEERARARARERAREREHAEARAVSERWARWEREQTGAGPTRPQRPTLLDAPPLGCADHPWGSLEPCGPCGTAADRREEWLAKQKYIEELAIFEELRGDGGEWDEPF